MSLASNEPQGQRRANLDPEFIEAIARQTGHDFLPDGHGDLKSTMGPEDVFDYMYAILYSPDYRQRYADFLRIDFPRLPLTSNVDLLRELCGCGRELIALHLMEGVAPQVITTYPRAGDNRVENVRYTEPVDGVRSGSVWINSKQHFEGVSPEVWEFRIGGYRVCEKWLKDRRGRLLSYEDLTLYQRVIATLAETIRLTERIDEVIATHGGWPIQ